jgi:hypothetical protein
MAPLDDPVALAVIDLMPNSGAQYAVILANFYKEAWTDTLCRQTVLGDIVQQRFFCGDWLSPDPWARRMFRSAIAIQRSTCGDGLALSGAAYSVYCALGAYLVFSEWFARHMAFQLVSAILPPSDTPAFWENEHVTPHLPLLITPSPELQVICTAILSLTSQELVALARRLQLDAKAAAAASGLESNHWQHYLLRRQPFLVPENLN